jgi:hypothetical protein
VEGILSFGVSYAYSVFSLRTGLWPSNKIGSDEGKISHSLKHFNETELFTNENKKKRSAINKLEC